MPSVDETTSYFDRHAERLRAERLVDKSAALRELLFDKLKPASRVVEVGAGTGLYTRTLLADGHTVLAIDLSQPCLVQIQESVAGTEQAGRLSVRAGDFLNVARELDRQGFDAVTFIKVLHHFPDRAAIQQALSVAYELLRPGGRLLIFEPNGSYPLWPPVLMSRGLEHWQNERNVLLVRRRFLEQVVTTLPGAKSSCRYRFVIPGTLAKHSTALAKLDGRLCSSNGGWLEYLAVNVSFDITKAT